MKGNLPASDEEEKGGDLVVGENMRKGGTILSWASHREAASEASDEEESRGAEMWLKGGREHCRFNWTSHTGMEGGGREESELAFASDEDAPL